jgi:hypothetical protein
MSIIDKQRVAAVAKLEGLGYTFSLAEGWSRPDTSSVGTLLSTAEADAMHSVLVLRAGALKGCSEGAPEEAELKTITDAIKAYEAARWPDGKVPDGTG